ncbi:hypothetical protein VCHA40O235_20484 [Vibrio chagasii]|nr:hypothetical protein VCHA40O235_20484 [Vibrio chagasii]
MRVNVCDNHTAVSKTYLNLQLLATNFEISGVATLPEAEPSLGGMSAAVMAKSLNR